MKTLSFISLFGLVALLTSCAPTATAVGTLNPPVSYTFAPGYNPPQVTYPDVISDSDPYTGSDDIIIIHHK